MTNKLNEQYFKTRRNHERNYKNRKRLTWKRRLLNIVITWIGFYIVSVGYDYLYNRYEENKRRDMLYQQNLQVRDEPKDTLELRDSTNDGKIN